jgi:quercetin dioxygenase-like cupin family protein
MPANLPHAVKATEKFSMLLTLIKPVEPEPGLSRVKAATLATQ